MPDQKKTRSVSGKPREFRRKTRYSGRGKQVWIYLGKFLRMLIYQNDWKVFPISALIAGLLAYVIRTDFMRTMEGTLKGAFAITCVALWNGCFNSIQVICRERDIVKREHRAGMHITSYVIAHMIYEGLLCLGQTALTLYVFNAVGIDFGSKGIMTRSLWLDLAITIFLITFAADMLALLISSIVRTTTSAMTVMPFVLIFQLVFSGGIFSLPAWTRPLTNITLSNPGLTCICAQSNYNSLPMASAWNALRGMRDTEIGGTFRLEDVLKYADEENAQNSELIRELRDVDLSKILQGDRVDMETAGTEAAGVEASGVEAAGVETAGTEAVGVEAAGNEAAGIEAAGVEASGVAAAGVDAGNAPEGRIKSAEEENLPQDGTNHEIPQITVGQVLDALAQDPTLEELRSREFTGSVTIGEIIDVFGEKEVKKSVAERSSQAGKNGEYESTRENVLGCWMTLIFYALMYAVLAIVSLEFVDKDKR